MQREKLRNDNLISKLEQRKELSSLSQLKDENEQSNMMRKKSLWRDVVSHKLKMKFEKQKKSQDRSQSGIQSMNKGILGKKIQKQGLDSYIDILAQEEQMRLNKLKETQSQQARALSQLAQFSEMGN